MTALLSRDGTNFSLACDRCGHLVARLADTGSRWDPSWTRLRQHGWTGAALPTGPHACPSCTQVPAAPRPTEKLLTIAPLSIREGRSWRTGRS